MRPSISTLRGIVPHFMTDEDIDKRRESGPASPPHRGPEVGFSQFVTLTLSLMLIGLLACLSLPDNESARLMQVEKPVETAERVFERNLWIEDAITTLPAWTRGVVSGLLETGGSTREEAIRAFEDILVKNGYPRPTLDGTTEPVAPALLDGLRARRAVLLADVGRLEEAEGELQHLSAAGHVTFVDAVRRAWSRVRSDDVRPLAAYDVSIAGDDWIGKLVQLRLAAATGSDADVARIEREVDARRDVLAARLFAIALGELVPLLAGFLVLLVWIARNRPNGPTSSAEIPPPWAFQDGYAVVVRAAFAAIGIAFVLGQGAEMLDQRGAGAWAAGLTAWGTLLMALPMLWLVRRRLLAPHGISFPDTFGLKTFPRPLWWIGFALCLFAVDQLGTRAILDLFRMGGLGLHWSEGFQSFAIWDPKPLVLAQSLDVCAWSPIFEEIGFRGLLYATLRRQYRPWQAALLSAALYGAPHLHSLPGLVSLTWSGFVYALAFERCRSILPAILCSAWAGAFAIAVTVLLYR
jgi:membrane protease YdiL (CAAX protease family)